jgi:hypothetical protein
MIAGIAIAIARAIERDFVLTKVPALFRRFVVRLGVSSKITITTHPRALRSFAENARAVHVRRQHSRQIGSRGDTERVLV